MKVHILIYVPYGAPAHDVDVLGVFDSLKKAKDKRKEMSGEDGGYEARELCIITKELK